MASINIAGDTSGVVTLQAPSVAGSTTLNLPATSGTVLTQNPSAPANSFVVNASGNVGIGTASPAQQLSVGDSLNLHSGVVNTNVTANPVIRATTNLVLNAGSGAGTYVNFDRGDGFFVHTNGSERMRIDSSGNLFIGTTTNPVSNAVGIINAVVSSGDGFNLKHTVNGNNMFNLWQTGTTTYTALAFNKGDTQTLRGGISVSTSSVAYNTTSDYRLKENVLPMAGALDTVAQLKPVTYNWKENGSDGQGFIAHELQEVIPDAVTGQKDAVDEEGNPVYQGIDTSFLVATLTAAIQELNAKVEAQAEQIKALQGAV
jgi:hypothetical protein